MELVFKEVKGTENVGDLTWIHSSGSQAVIADMVSGTDVKLGLKILNDYLNDRSSNELFEPSALINDIHVEFQKNNVQTVLGILTKLDDQLDCSVVGNLRLFNVTAEVVVSDKIDLEAQPGQLVGQEPPLKIDHFSLTVSGDELYVLTTDGVQSDTFSNSGIRYEAFKSGNLKRLFFPSVIDQDWSALIFPISETQSFSRNEWPYNPFEGPQEERLHERRGLSEVATELFKVPHFDGFRLVACPPILSENSSRLFDGLLVYPYGVIPLELKDHHGSILIEIDSTQRNSLYVQNEIGDSKLANPVHKLRESLRRFGDLKAFDGLDALLKNLGLVVFTSKSAEVQCKYQGDVSQPPFYEAGEVLVATTENVNEALLFKAKQRFGKKLKPRLSVPEINQLVKKLVEVQETNNLERLLIGDYECSSEELLDESSDYYSVFEAWSFGDPLWAKRFKFDHLSNLERQTEIHSLGRESQTLNRLGKHQIKGIQYCYGKEVDGDSLYVFLESAPEKNLLDWLSHNPVREQKIQVLQKTAEILQGIQSVGDSFKVIHRAINPKNIRISESNEPMLINFELCQLETVATLPINVRRTFEQRYQAPEVNSPGKELTYAADIFSLGLIAVEVLSGKLPFKDSPKELAQKLRNKKFWINLCNEMGIGNENIEFLQRSLHVSSIHRPEINQVIETFKTWK